MNASAEALRRKKVSGPSRPGTTEWLWKRLTDTRDLGALAPAWLEMQCRRLKCVVRAVVVRVAEDGSFQGIALWPEAGVDVTPLEPAVNIAIAQGSGIVQRGEMSTGLGDAGAARSRTASARIAYPFRTPDGDGGAVALELDVSGDAALRRAMREVQWGAAWLEACVVREALDASRRSAERTAGALECLAAGLEEERFESACRAVATELSLRMECDRASLGFVRKDGCTVRTISNSARFAKRMNLVRMLGAAMDEALDQHAAIVHPAGGQALHVTRAHQELARAHGCEAILTVPIIAYDRFVGAVCLERKQGPAFGPEEMESVASIAAVVGPMLEEKRRNDRWVATKVVEAGVNQMRRLLGPGYFKRKLVACLVMVAGSFFYFAQGQYQISADAEVRGRIQRAVVAALDGFVMEAYVRAGDVVAHGDPIAVLDDSDLVLERFKWVTERQRSTYEFERALGEGRRVESQIAQSRIAQAQSSIELIDQQIARIRMTAPFDGIVVSGDLSQSVGAAVGRGEVLFEVAPLDAYRVTLEVDESQIRDVAPGLRGQLRLAALPEERFPIVVEQITPVAVVREGRTFFRVEAGIEGEVGRLRPRMFGIARIEVDRRRLLWIWTRSFMDWLSIVAWRWIG